MSEWAKCFNGDGRGCLEKFIGKTKQDSLKLLEAHFVSTPEGRKCMSKRQLELSFKFDEINKGWRQK